MPAPHKKMSFFFFFTVLFVLSSQRKEGDWKIACITSYKENVPWLGQLKLGLKRAFSSGGYYYKVNLNTQWFYMNLTLDNQNINGSEYLNPAVQAGKVVDEVKIKFENLEDVDIWVIFDDDAFEHVGMRKLNFTNKIVFGSVRRDLEEYNDMRKFYDKFNNPGHNVTGIFCHIKLNETIDIAKKIFEEANLYVHYKSVILVEKYTSPGRLYSIQIEEEVNKTKDTEIKYISDYKEMKKVLAELCSSDDVGMIFFALFAIPENKEKSEAIHYNYETLTKYIIHYSKCKIPVVGLLNIFSTKHGLIQSIGNDHRNIAYKVGEKCVDIIEGRFPGNITLEYATKMISLNNDSIKIFNSKWMKNSNFIDLLSQYETFVFEDKGIPGFVYAIIFILSILLLSFIGFFFCIGVYFFINKTRKAKLDKKVKKFYEKYIDTVKFSVEINNLNLEEIEKDIGKTIDSRDIKCDCSEKSEDLLGSGNFGKCFKAEYKGVDCCWKLFTKGKYNEEEMKIHEKLKHENIARLYFLVDNTENVIKNDFGEEVKRIDLKKYGKYSILMERGRMNLREYIFDPSKVRDPSKDVWGTKLMFFWGIVKGLRYLKKEKNIEHRDLKFENVIIGQDKRAKIIDFGECVKIGTETKIGGNLDHMAPEVLYKYLRSIESIDYCENFEKVEYSSRSDVYSFGIMLYQLFYDKEYPWEEFIGKSYFNQTPKHIRLLKKIVQQKLRPKIENRDKGHVLMKLCEKCFEENKNDRPELSEIEEVIKKEADQYISFKIGNGSQTIKVSKSLNINDDESESEIKYLLF